MNKLISRNPVQRFKQGRKIVKAQNSWGKDFGTTYIPPENATEVPKNRSYFIDLGTTNTWHMDNDIINHDFSSYSSDDNLNYPHSGLVGDAYRDLYDTQQRALQIATHNIKKASEPFRRRSYDNSVMDPERSYGAENKRYYSQQGKGRLYTENGNNYWIGSDGSKTFISGKVIGKDGKEYWKGSDGSMTLLKSNKSIKNTKPLRNPNVIAWQNKLKDFYEPGTFKADGMWGKNTEAAYQKYLQLVNVPEMSQEEAKAATTPKQVQFVNPINLNSTPIQVPQTYNRTQVREFLRNKGVNPYSFSGDQRRAVRMVLNGQGTDEDKALVQSMGIFKKGGQLLSRNPITRFKNRNFRLVAQ